jgi:hypothetical protein
MADYYPLLAKAVSALPESNAETRRAIYERARKALLGQLRKIEPPIAEADIDRESNALDESVARLEAEIAARAARELSETPEKPAEPEAAPPPQAASPESERQELAAPEAEKKVEAEPPRPAVPPPPPRPAGPAPRFPTPPRPSPFRTAPDAKSQETKPAEAREGEPTGDADASAPQAEPPKKPFSFRPPPPVRPAGEAETTAEPAAEPPAETPELDQPVSPELRPPRPREAPRPLAPSPAADSSPSKRLWIVGGVVVAVVLMVAGVAIKLRDRPEDLSRLRPVAPAESPQPQGKIAERADKPGSGKAEPQPAAPSPNQSAPAQPPLPVAHRAALLIEAPDTPEKVKTYIGSVVWRLDNVPGGPGRPLGTAVHADVDIPEAKVRMSLDMQKNLDESLPASHTIEVRFTLLPGSDIPGIKQIGTIQMRREDASNGDNLAGIPVQITDNYFLIGLGRGDLEARNIDLLKSRGWLDVPIALTNGRIAKFSLEKGVSGERVISDAITAWDQQK